MAWKIILGESATEDLRWFGRKIGRLLLEEVQKRLTSDPLTETRNNKTLRPNPMAQRELRVSGKYRILYDVDAEEQVIKIIAVGEKKGNILLIRGEGFNKHEDHLE